ncbi:MAG: EVE domain-containing protein [bacterium]|nr:EVE domain-containing protein [bacterium]
MSEEKNIWIFQATPKRFNIIKALNNPEYDWDFWSIRQHKSEIKKDDLALIWVSGQDSGIYAVAGIICDPYKTGEINPITDEYFIDEKELADATNPNILKVKIKYSGKFVDAPLLKSRLNAVKGLENLSIIQMPRGTNFLVTRNEWKIISNLIGK